MKKAKKKAELRDGQTDRLTDWLTDWKRQTDSSDFTGPSVGWGPTKSEEGQGKLSSLLQQGERKCYMLPWFLGIVSLPLSAPPCIGNFKWAFTSKKHSGMV